MTDADDTRMAIAGFGGDLRTKRLCLKPVLPADSAALHTQFNDWDVVRWLALPAWPQQPHNMDRYIAACVEAQHEGRSLALTLHLDRIPVGLIAWERSGSSSHLGYWLGRPHWGKGYVSEAAAALCDWVFAATPEAAIHSGVFEGNHASLAIQKKLGFVEIGRSVHYSGPRGTDLMHIDTKLTRTMRRVVLERTTR